VATTLLLLVLAQRNFTADVFREKFNCTGKTAKSRFVPPFGGLRGVIHGSSMACPWAITWRFCLRHPMFGRFGTILACDRRTDGRTDRRSTLIPALA